MPKRKKSASRLSRGKRGKTTRRGAHKASRRVTVLRTTRAQLVRDLRREGRRSRKAAEVEAGEAYRERLKVFRAAGFGEEGEPTERAALQASLYRTAKELERRAEHRRFIKQERHGKIKKGPRKGQTWRTVWWQEQKISEEGYFIKGPRVTKRQMAVKLYWEKWHFTRDQLERVHKFDRKTANQLARLLSKQDTGDLFGLPRDILDQLYERDILSPRRKKS